MLCMIFECLEKNFSLKSFVYNDILLALQVIQTQFNKKLTQNVIRPSIFTNDLRQ